MVLAPDERVLLDALAASERQNASEWVRQQVLAVAAEKFGDNRVVEADGEYFEVRDTGEPGAWVARRVRDKGEVIRRKKDGLLDYVGIQLKTRNKIVEAGAVPERSLVRSLSDAEIARLRELIPKGPPRVVSVSADEIPGLKRPATTPRKPRK
jgi:hypothetical protein